jgi:hypothetical protein
MKSALEPLMSAFGVCTWLMHLKSALIVCMRGRQLCSQSLHWQSVFKEMPKTSSLTYIGEVRTCSLHAKAAAVLLRFRCICI